MIRIERVSPMMVLYNDEEQGTGGFCDLLKTEIAKLEYRLGLTKKQCRIVYERLLAYQVLLYDPRSKRLLRERPTDVAKPIVYPKGRDGNSLDEKAKEMDDKINDIFNDQAGLKKPSTSGIIGSWE